MKYNDLFRVHPDDYEYGTPEFEEFTKARQQRLYLTTFYQLLLTEMSEKIKTAGFTTYADKFMKEYHDMLPEATKIPIPKPVK